jgi:hypothetical protein
MTLSFQLPIAREGLGIEQARREQIERQLQDMKSEEKLTEEEFREHQRLTFERRRIEAEIRQARRTCIQLDEAKVNLLRTQ